MNEAAIDFEWQVSPDSGRSRLIDLWGREPSAEIIAVDGTRTPMYTVRALVKWDGCVNLNQYYNGHHVNDGCTDDCDTDLAHFDDLDQFIAMLQALGRKAREYFGEWPG